MGLLITIEKGFFNRLILRCPRGIMKLEATIESRVMNTLKVTLNAKGSEYEIKIQRLSRLVRLRKLMNLGL
jgi:hypothetical protein